MSKKTSRAVLSAFAIGTTLAILLFMTMRGDAAYYMHVDEVMPAAADWYGKSLQLHGFVVDGSIERRPNTLDYRFKVKNGDAVVTATYTGIVPDTFKDGAEVVLKGRLDQTGFQVERDGVMAKCPSKYEETAEGPAKYRPATGSEY
jgi:cytochrome c-type biogenesis protein CcmE